MQAATPTGISGADPATDHLAALEHLLRELLADPDEPDELLAICAEHVGGGGKRLRSRVAFGVAEALDGSPARSLPWAAAVELLHDATLVHDDIEDGDTVRRGRPSVWARYGVSRAINAGDLLLMLPVRALARLAAPAELKFALAERLAEAAVRLARGQAAEQSLLARGALGRADWEAAATGKSGALFGLPAAGAALLAGVDPDGARALGTAFARLGVLYQAWDDCLDLWGDTGRGAVGNDLREGKVSAVVVEHLRERPADRDWLVEHLRRERSSVTDADVRSVLARFASAGTEGAVRRRIAELEAEIDADPRLARWPRVRAFASRMVDRFRRRADARG